MNKYTKNTLASLALIPALGLTAFSSTAFAAVSTTTKNATSTRSTTSRAQHMSQFLKDNTLFAKDLASVLGLQASDVKAKLDTGVTVNAIIAETGMSKETVMTNMQTLFTQSMKARIATDVASGKITQEKADEMLTKIANRALQEKHIHTTGSKMITVTGGTITYFLKV